MAQEITAPLDGLFISGPGLVMTLADQTGTTAAQQFIGTGGRAIAVQRVDALIYLKTFVIGTTTAYPLFALEIATTSSFLAASTRRIASFQPALVEAVAAIPGTNCPHSISLRGILPDGGRGYWRIKAAVASGTGTFVYDVRVAAC